MLDVLDKVESLEMRLGEVDVTSAWLCAFCWVLLKEW